VKAYDGWSERGKRNCPDYIAITLNRQWRRDSLAFMAGADSEPKKKRAAAIRQFLDTLGDLVDQWIDSGKHEGDASIEEVWQRNIRWRSTDYPEPIITTLMAYRNKNHPQVVIDGDGRFSIFFAPTVTKQTDALVRARERAIFQFVMLLDSPTREHLSRCDKCRAYFVRARAPRKDMPIKRGIFCKNCKGLGGARRTAASREQRRKQMVGWASEYWLKWNHRHGKKAKWIAQQINWRLEKHYRIHDPITGKWVTQNEKSIEAEVERRNHAKS
jgi:hypothetical protein